MNKFIYHTGSDNFGHTQVENIFINEFMAEANGDYIKVYLYGLKNSQNQNLNDITTEEIAQRLNITESDFQRALNYWEDRGIIKVTYKKGEREIVFHNITEILYHKKEQPKPFTAPEDKTYEELIQEVERCFGGRPLTQKWNEKLRTWFYKYEMEPGTILYALEQMDESLGDKNTSLDSKLKYLNSIITNWNKHGIKTFQQAVLFNEENRAFNSIVYGVLKKLGIRNRNVMASEKKLIEKWVKEYGFSKEMIFAAAEKSREPYVDYVDGILRNWQSNGWKTIEEVVEQPRRSSSKKKNNTTLFKPVSSDRAEAIDKYEEDILASYKEKLAKFTDSNH